MNEPLALPSSRRALHETARLHLGYLALGLISLLVTLLAFPMRALLPRVMSKRLGRKLVTVATRRYLRFLMLIGACRFDLSELDALQGEAPMVIAPNHPSLLDAVMILSRLPGAGCIMKAELVNSVFGDAAYPPETLELQSLAIQKREERARLENPDLEEYQTVPGSAEMLEAHDSQWTFWRPHRKPGVPHSRFIARQGESDDNYSEFNHTAEWKRWGQQNGVRVIIDRGEHNGLGGLQQQADTKLFQISMQNVRLIIDMMQRDLRKKTWWMTRDVNRRRAELNLSKKVLGGLQM